MRSKWVTSQVGRNVAKLNSRRVAKIAVDRSEHDIVVYGSVMMERFRTRLRGAVLGEFIGDSGRRSMNGTAVLMTLAKVVKINVEGWIRKKDDSKIICGVDRNNEADATSYAARSQLGPASNFYTCFLTVEASKPIDGQLHDLPGQEPGDLRP
jgi:hypothetical protein